LLTLKELDLLGWDLKSDKQAVMTDIGVSLMTMTLSDNKEFLLGLQNFDRYTGTEAKIGIYQIQISSHSP